MPSDNFSVVPVKKNETSNKNMEDFLFEKVDCYIKKLNESGAIKKPWFFCIRSSFTKQDFHNKKTLFDDLKKIHGKFESNNNPNTDLLDDFNEIIDKFRNSYKEFLHILPKGSKSCDLLCNLRRSDEVESTINNIIVNYLAWRNHMLSNECKESLEDKNNIIKILNNRKLLTIQAYQFLEKQNNQENIGKLLRFIQKLKNSGSINKENINNLFVRLSSFEEKDTNEIYDFLKNLDEGLFFLYKRDIRSNININIIVNSKNPKSMAWALWKIRFYSLGKITKPMIESIKNSSIPNTIINIIHEFKKLGEILGVDEIKKMEIMDYDFLRTIYVDIKEINALSKNEKKLKINSIFSNNLTGTQLIKKLPLN